MSNSCSSFNPLTGSRDHPRDSATFGSLSAVAVSLSLGCVAFRTHMVICGPPVARWIGILLSRCDAGGNLNRADYIPNKVATHDKVLGATRRTTVLVGDTV
jgi:hypothetical protein